MLLLDVLFGARIANTPHAMTSVRWLTTADAKGGYSGLVGNVFKARRAAALTPNPNPNPNPNPSPSPNIFKACRALGVLQPGELFDSEVRHTGLEPRAIGDQQKGSTAHTPEPCLGQSWKTKCVFILVQLLYTVVTLLPVVWLWESFPLHLAYLLAIYTYSIWNGGSYYIEVFSKA